MKHDTEIYDFLLRHIESILNNDLETYHATTSEELTLYEWWITPHRLEGLPFHDFMMSENARRGQVFGSEGESDPRPNISNTRFDFSNLLIQRYGDTAIASYTLLISTSTQNGVTVASHNESRVIVKIDGKWMVVHVHKSPDWPAPHVEPGKWMPNR